MKFLNYIKEEYVNSIVVDWTGKKVRAEIFVNPSPKEMQAAPGPGYGADYVRFFVNFKTKRLYVWNANVIHHEALELLYDMKLMPSMKLENPKWWNTCFAGAGKIISNKIKYGAASDYLNDEPYLIRNSSWLKSDDSWLNKWFTEPLIQSIKNDYSEVFKKYTNEEYAASGRGVEIFKDPTAKEILSIKEPYIRFIADFKKKNLFVFSGGCLHNSALGILKKEGQVEYLYSFPGDGDKAAGMVDSYALGTANVLRGGKLEFYRSDTGAAWHYLWERKPFEWMKMDDSWLNHWFTSPFIKSYIELSTPGKVKLFK